MLAEWITAIATAVMALIALIAAWYAKSQWQESQELRKHTQKEASMRRAAGLNAWWLFLESPDGENQWGVVVDNSSDTAFYDVALECVYGEDRWPLKLNFAPPGTHFFQSNFENGKLQWDFARVLHVDEVVQRPVLRAGAKKHGILSVTFTDSAAARWELTPGKGLRRISMN